MAVDEHGVSRRLSDDLWSNATSRCTVSLSQKVTDFAIADLYLRLPRYVDGLQ